MKKKDNVTEFPKFININIGVVIFIIIFIYLLFNVLTYLTKVHISVYEVEQGTIAANNIYKGLVLRDETTYSSEYSGSINYYVKEYSKVGFNDLIYTVDENGSVSERLNEAKHNLASLSSRATNDISDILEGFKLTYDNESFYQVYALKDEINSALNEALSLDALEQISVYADTAESNNTFHKGRAQKDGIVSFYVDGFEKTNADMFEPAMMDESVYKRTNLNVNAKTQAGSIVYKMIHSEIWNVLLPVPEKVALEMIDDLVEDNLVRIRFVKDMKEMYAEYEVRETKGEYFLILTLKNAMIRYASDRFLEVELLLAEETGLKIPNTSIVEKEFYTIPDEFFLKGDDSSADGLLLERIDKNGNRTTEFIKPTIYYKTDEYSYIDSEFVQSGDILQKPNSVEKYTIGDNTATLEGVYNINKGYAVFKQIEVMLQNEEYSIVKTGTNYGIALYDHIALDGSKIQEDELIK